MGRLEAEELALDGLLDPVLDVALVSLVELKVAVSILWLTRVASSVAPKRRHLI